ncbi:hypothetical protein DFH05DRAFT_1486022 [Lentinula detonsa]|uniref:Uncharacterized protein n=1 Tax=Lentinula detonsa TaxID=2804962 RepID=A0A9W8P495_9AGAR|nr:hypothetical protein DFH05DRAFT_1486022 [Lentinula detonsa]
MYGDTFFHAFNTTIDPTIGISSFEIIVEDSIDQGGSSRMTIFTNSGNGYPVQDRVFVMNSRSILDEEGRATLTAAVLSSGMTISSVTATFSFPIPQIGTMSPGINSLSLPLTSLNSSTISNLGYTLFNASTQLPLGNSNAYQVTVDVTAALGDEEVMDKFRRLRL